MEKEALTGEIQEDETTEMLKEIPARRSALCWTSWWMPTPLLMYLR